LTTTTSTYTCPYCRQTSAGAGASCPSCGAPVDIELRTTSGGWTELPPIADMARIQVGHSQVEVSGRNAPIADWSLGAGEGVYFPHHVLVWKEPSVELSPMPLKRAWARHRAGLPLVMLSAKGPGRIAFSHDRAGEAMALPVAAGAAVDVCEGHLVVASENIDYDWNDSNVWYATNPQSADMADSGAGLGLLNVGLQAARMAGVGDSHEDRRERREIDDRYDESTGWHYPVGRYVDRFTAGDRPGLVMIGAGGAAFIRDLAEGESLLVKPPSLLFKDPSVAMQLHVEYPAAGVKLWRAWGNRYLWLRLHGPGRIGIESSYLAYADPGTDFRDMSQATRHSWDLNPNPAV
jgi:uncharacterized protein (AIM24 family)